MKKLPIKIASLDTIPENKRDLYTKPEGSEFYYLTELEGIDEHPEVVGLKNSKETILGEKKAADQKVAAWTALGKTPEEIAALLKEQGDAATAKKIADGKIDEVLADERARHASAMEALTNNHKTELETRTSREGTLLKGLHKALRENAIDDALRTTKGKPSLLRDKLMNETELVEVKNGEETDFVVRVRDGKGGHKFADSVGNYMTPLQYVETLKRDVDNYGGAFEATKPGGSGAPSGSTRPGGAPPTTTGGGADQPRTGVSRITAGLASQGGNK